MSNSVFIETTIPSYYVARRSRDIVQAARQELTMEWWDNRRSRYELLSSQIVVDEAARGEEAMAEKRLAMIADVPLLARISHRHLSIRRKWVLRAMVRHGWDEQGTTVKLRAGFRGIVDSKWPSFGGNRCD